MLVPEMLRYIESALRMEDAIFRMTRERAVLFVSDVDLSNAERIVDRLIHGFQERFPTLEPVDVSLGYYEVAPGAREISAKEILPSIFTRKSRL
jgi:GGDEF domain-containing protein